MEGTCTFLSCPPGAEGLFTPAVFNAQNAGGNNALKKTSPDRVPLAGGTRRYNRQQWEARHREIESMSIAKRNRRNLLALACKHEAEALAKTKQEFQPERNAVRRDVP